MYGWALKWLLAAILIATGIVMRVFDNYIVYLTTGIAIVIYSVFRVVPLMKTLKKEVLRTINLFEIVFDILLGALMLYVVFSNSTTNQFWISFYGYLLVFFLLSRGMIYFISMYYFGEKSEALKFWFHIACMLLAPAVLVLTILNIDILHTLGWVLLFVSFGGAAYLGYDGYGGYKKYRQSSKDLNEEKKEVKNKEVEKELPKPQPEEEKQEETYIS